MPARTSTSISVLSECLITLTPLGADNAENAQKDWIEETWPTSGVVTLCVDSLKLSRSRTLQDFSTAQQSYDKQRVVKSSFTINIETKLFMDGLDLGWLTGGQQIVGINVTSQKASFWVPCIVESFDVTYGSPSTLSATLRSYGFPIQWDVDSDWTPPV